MRAMAKKKSHKPSNVIAQNRRASFDYHLLENFEAGVALSGWEVKSLRMGKADLADSYVLMKDGEAFLLGSHIVPLDTVSTHYVTDPSRTRKLLLNKKELAKLQVAVTQKGQTCVCTQLYWKGHLVRPALHWPRARRPTTSATARKTKIGTARNSGLCVTTSSNRPSVIGP